MAVCIATSNCNLTITNFKLHGDDRTILIAEESYISAAAKLYQKVLLWSNYKHRAVQWKWGFAFATIYSIQKRKTVKISRAQEDMHAATHTCAGGAGGHHAYSKIVTGGPFSCRHKTFYGPCRVRSSSSRRVDRVAGFVRNQLSPLAATAYACAHIALDVCQRPSPPMLADHNGGSREI